MAKRESSSIWETGWSKEILKQAIEGTADPQVVRRMQIEEKDEHIFEKILEIEQERVSWAERIVVPLQENLYVVLKDGAKIVKCFCGYEFGNYKENWKLEAMVYERNPEDEEIYSYPRGADGNWVVLREFYCPGCGHQFEVELVPHGYPIIFNSQPDIEGFFAKRPDLAARILGV